jgi:flagellin-like protein
MNEKAVCPVIGVILMVAITVILAAIISVFVFGTAENISKTEQSSIPGTCTVNKTCEKIIEIIFFYGDGCSHCENVKPFITELENKYPGILVKKYELYHTPDNYETFKKYGNPEAGVPQIVINNKIYIGDKVIEKELENEIIRTMEAC